MTRAAPWLQDHDRQFAVADDQRFKREVERRGVTCTLLGHGESVMVGPFGSAN